jgi:hypothetical protein
MLKKSLVAACICAVFVVMTLCLSAPVEAGLPAPPLPPLLLPAPPPVVLIPDTYAYFAPDVDGELIFYHGYWYRPYEGRWYRSSRYRGPWGFIAIGRVPRVLLDLPPGYRTVPPGHQRIPYGQLKKNWSSWEQDRHWDKVKKKKKQDDRKEHGKGFGQGGGKGHGR